ncbi:MAG TPA: preprotein translocase subunit SecG [Candidatus Saccharimonadales bacterium]|nr:preprotein translocase subunit SecG [Candidatus Saccharimonadales bacterium]
MIRNILLGAQIVTSCLLIIVVLLQAKGSGIGAAFGADAGFYRSKRGVEKLFVYLTVFLTVLFLALAVLLVRV